MKKGFFLMLLAAGSMSVFAQDDTLVRTNNLNPATNAPYMTTTNDNGSITLLSTGDYSAYSAPSNVQLYFNRDYPTINTTVNWMPVGEWWRATYADKGRYNHVFYTSSGDHFLVTLPVTTTWVPDDIVVASANAHPGTVYDITALKAWDGSNVYQVRYLDNGTITTEWINDQGVTVSEYYRTADMEQKMDELRMQNMHLNNSNIEEMKIKTDEDGTKIKVETKDGQEYKTKLKNSDIPTTVQAGFTRDYPTITTMAWHPNVAVSFDRTLAGWPAVSANEYVVQFNRDNRDYYAWYDANGNQIGSSYMISDYTTLPVGISTSINTNFPNHTISSANWLSRNGTASYQLTLVGDNNHQVKVMFDENGNVISQL